MSILGSRYDLGVKVSKDILDMDDSELPSGIFHYCLQSHLREFKIRMNIQGKALEGGIKRWKELPDFMEDQFVDYGEDQQEIIDFLYDFHCFMNVDLLGKILLRNTKLST